MEFWLPFAVSAIKAALLHFKADPTKLPTFAKILKEIHDEIEVLLGG